MNLLRYASPFIFLVGLFVLLWWSLFYSDPGRIPSPLIGEDLPSFRLPELSQPHQTFSQHDLAPQVSLINFWASWCYACHLEHPVLMKIANEYHIPIYGINYKDNPTAARKWLKKYGDPYRATGLDQHGEVAINFGVYGTPETFVISKQHKIIYRHIGILDEHAWNTILLPLIQNFAQTS